MGVGINEPKLQRGGRGGGFTAPRRLPGNSNPAVAPVQAHADVATLSQAVPGGRRQMVGQYIAMNDVRSPQPPVFDQPVIAPLPTAQQLFQAPQLGSGAGGGGGMGGAEDGGISIRDLSRAAADLIWPLAGYGPQTTPVTNPFGGKQYVSTAYAGTVTSPRNNGVDLGVPGGTPVVAPAKGRVVEVRVAGQNDGGWGNSIVIQDNADRFHRFSHLRQAPNREVGQIVDRGNWLGEVGKTGNTNGGEHLDYEAWTIGPNGQKEFLDARSLYEPRVTPASGSYSMPSPKKNDWTASFGEHVARAAQKYGIPSNLLFGLIDQESNGNPAARGSSGEIGLTQVMPATAQMMGFDPAQLAQDPLMQIEAGARYLADMARQSGGDWKAALGKYNAGPAGNIQSGQVQSYTKSVLQKAEARIPEAGTFMRPSATFDPSSMLGANADYPAAPPAPPTPGGQRSEEPVDATGVGYLRDAAKRARQELTDIENRLAESTNPDEKATLQYFLQQSLQRYQQAATALAGAERTSAERNTVVSAGAQEPWDKFITVIKSDGGVEKVENPNYQQGTQDPRLRQLDLQSRGQDIDLAGVNQRRDEALLHATTQRYIADLNNAAKAADMQWDMTKTQLQQAFNERKLSFEQAQAAATEAHARIMEGLQATQNQLQARRDEITAQDAELQAGVQQRGQDIGRQTSMLGMGANLIQQGLASGVSAGNAALQASMGMLERTGPAGTNARMQSVLDAYSRGSANPVGEATAPAPQATPPPFDPRTLGQEVANQVLGQVRPLADQLMNSAGFTAPGLVQMPQRPAPVNTAFTPRAPIFGGFQAP